MPALTTHILGLEVLAREIRQKKKKIEKKRHPNHKKEEKLFLLADVMILHIEDPKNSTKKS